jgi:hypothetical protein
MTFSGKRSNRGQDCVEEKQKKKKGEKEGEEGD